MSKEVISLNLVPRDIVGKQVKGLRREGLVPTVVHDHGKDSILGSAKYLELEKVLRQAGKHAPIELKIGNKQRLALIKDVDIDPKKRGLRHVVFQAIKQDEKVESEVPLHLVGEIPAERTGLLVLKTLEHVQVEALPRDLPDSFEVDATVLAEIGDRITVADLVVPSGVTVMTEPEQMIAVVEEPKVHEEEVPETEELEGEEGEAAEGAEKPADDGEKPKEKGEEE